jgi:hypothetical protein
VPWDSDALRIPATAHAQTLCARLGRVAKQVPADRIQTILKMVTVSLIKILVTLLGLLGTFGILIAGVITKDKSRYKRAGLLFAGTWVILILITIIEFAVA